MINRVTDVTPQSHTEYMSFRQHCIFTRMFRDTPKCLNAYPQFFMGLGIRFFIFNGLELRTQHISANKGIFNFH